MTAADPHAALRRDTLAAARAAGFAGLDTAYGMTRPSLPAGWEVGGARPGPWGNSVLHDPGVLLRRWLAGHPNDDSTGLREDSSDVEEDEAYRDCLENCINICKGDTTCEAACPDNCRDAGDTSGSSSGGDGEMSEREIEDAEWRDACQDACLDKYEKGLISEYEYKQCMSRCAEARPPSGEYREPDYLEPPDNIGACSGADWFCPNVRELGEAGNCGRGVGVVDVRYRSPQFWSTIEDWKHRASEIMKTPGFTKQERKIIRYALAFLLGNIDLVEWACCWGTGRADYERDGVRDTLYGNIQSLLDDSESIEFTLVHSDCEDEYVLETSLVFGGPKWPGSYGLTQHDVAYINICAESGTWAPAKEAFGCGSTRDRMNVKDRMCVIVDLAAALFHELIHAVMYPGNADDRGVSAEWDTCETTYVVENLFRWAAFRRYPPAAASGCCSGMASETCLAGSTYSYSVEGPDCVSCMYYASGMSYADWSEAPEGVDEYDPYN